MAARKNRPVILASQRGGAHQLYTFIFLGDLLGQVILLAIQCHLLLFYFTPYCFSEGYFVWEYTYVNLSIWRLSSYLPFFPFGSKGLYRTLAKTWGKNPHRIPERIRNQMSWSHPGRKEYWAFGGKVACRQRIWVTVWITLGLPTRRGRILAIPELERLRSNSISLVIMRDEVPPPWAITTPADISTSGCKLFHKA